MNIIYFILSLIVILVVWGAFSFRGKSLEEIKLYFSTHEGRGILKGVILAVIISILLAAISAINAGEYFNWASVYAGMDYTKNESPLCETEGVDDKSTSNLGLRLNLFESDDKNFAINSKYTHHSCAFNVDHNSYDAVGIELEYKLWSKN